MIDPSVDQGFRPLAGVRVLDFSTNVAGPFATMILAQLGADVIKVEAPGGDDARQWPPQENGVGIVHRQMNAGKRGVVIDLSLGGGRDAARRLAARADVLLQSMRPGVADRIGIGESAMRAANPDILYYALNAYGTGPAGRTLPGYDPLVQAFTGLMWMTGHDGSPPTRCAPSLIDLGSGQWIAMGILAAVLGRHCGQRVGTMETALVDTAFNLVPYQATTALMTGQRPRRAGSGNPIASPNQVYSARDGELMLAAPNQRLWERVVDVLGAPDLLDDPRFATVLDRSRNNQALEDVMTSLLRAADLDDWVARFGAAGVPVTRVRGLEEAVLDEIATERQTFAELDGVPLVRLPWMLDGHTVPWTRAAPSLGEHTRAVLAEAGFSDGEVAGLLDSGAVFGPGPDPGDSAA